MNKFAGDVTARMEPALDQLEKECPHIGTLDTPLRDCVDDNSAASWSRLYTAAFHAVHYERYGVYPILTWACASTT